jgi:hypothetical protein
MAFTKIVAAGINTGSSYTFQDLNTVGIVTAGTVQVGAATTVHTTGIDLGSGNITSHNINSTGIITATGFVGPVTGNVTGNTSGTAGGLSGSPSITVADITASGNVSIAGTLTYEDVTNIDSVGVITARQGLDTPTNLVLRTGGSERLRITSGGSVGIGTNNPQKTLHVNSSADNSFGIVRISGKNRGGQLEFCTDATKTAGIYSPTSSNELVFFTSSSETERLRITSGGDVVVKTSGTMSVGKFVFQEGTDDAFSFRTTGANGAFEIYDEYDNQSRLHINTSGNVGIGTDNPTEFVYLNKSGDYKLHLQSADSDNVGVRLWSTRNYIIQTGPAVNDGIRIYDETSGSAGERLRIKSNGVVQIGDAGLGSDNGDRKLDIIGSGNGQAGLLIANNATSASGTCDISFAPSNKITGAQIFCEAQEDFSTGANRTADLTFITRKDGTLSEKLRITSGGSVRVGEDGTFTADTGADELVIGSASNGVNRGMTILNHTGSDGRICFADSGDSDAGMIKYSHGSNVMQFFVESSEKLRMTNGSQIIATSSEDFYSRGFFFNVDGNSSNIQYNLFNLGNLSAAGTRPGYRHVGGMWIVLGTVPCDNTYRTMLTSFSGSSGMLHGYCGDASSRNIFQYQWNVTSPAYGVSPFSQRFNNGSWNTGSVALQIATNGSSYDLQIKATSHYSSSNNASFRIIFNTYY